MRALVPLRSFARREIPAACTLSIRPAGSVSSRIERVDRRLVDELPVGARLVIPACGPAHVVKQDEQTPELLGSSLPGISVAIIGASCAMGKLISKTAVGNMVDWKLPGPRHYPNSLTLKLIEHRRESQGFMLDTIAGLCDDFRNSHDEASPNLEVILDLEVVQADVIVICGSDSFSDRKKNDTKTNEAYLRLLDEHATALAVQNSASIAVVVSGSGDLVSDALVKAGFDRKRVFCTGRSLLANDAMPFFFTVD